MKQLKFLLLGDMIVLEEKSTSMGTMNFLVRETYVPNILAIIIISYLFLYRLVTYHWKGS
jgi:F420-0:gamma-glutamyl ligase-like protein